MKIVYIVKKKGSRDNKYYYCNTKRKTINVYNCTSCPLRIEKTSNNTIEKFFKGFGGFR